MEVTGQISLSIFMPPALLPRPTTLESLIASRFRDSSNDNLFLFLSSQFAR